MKAVLFIVTVALFCTASVHGGLVFNGKGATRRRNGELTNRSPPQDVISPRRNDVPSQLPVYQVIAKVKPLFALGLGGVVLYEVGKRLDALEWLTQIPNASRNGGSRFASKQDMLMQGQLQQLLEAVTSIRDVQKEAAEMSVQLRRDLDILADRVATSQVESDLAIKLLNEKMEYIEQSIAGVQQSITLDTFHTLKDMEGSLIALEDKQERERQAMQASIAQLKEDIPQAVERHGQAVTQKLEKFKQDLRDLIAKLSVSKDKRGSRNNQ